MNTSRMPRPAATVILVREKQGSLQLYLLKRNPESSFFPGFHVFPGGVVDAEDIKQFESAAERGKLTGVIQWLAAGYEYLIIDAPVGVGVIVKSLLAASDHYLAVINCKAGTMKTLPRLMKTAEWVKQNVNANLNFMGVLVNSYDAANSSEQKIYKYFKSNHKHIRLKIP